MSQATATAEHVPTEARLQSKVAALGPVAWARAHLFSSVWSTAVTLALGYVIVRVLFSLVGWGLGASTSWWTRWSRWSTPG